MCSVSSNPLSSKDEAILQAKTLLLSSLEKPINSLKLTGKIKKSRQPRFRVEIAIIDDSSASLAQWTLEIFVEMPIKRKGPQFKILIFWPNKGLTQVAVRAFSSHTTDVLVQNVAISEILEEGIRIANSTDVVVSFCARCLAIGYYEDSYRQNIPKAYGYFQPQLGI